MSNGNRRLALAPGTPDDIFITRQLLSRPARRTNAEAETAALRLIARHMADSPEALLPSFVQLAMTLTEAGSSGLALLDDGDPETLVWTHLFGTMQRFEGRRTARNRAFADAALLPGGPILFAHPERMFDWAAAAGLSFPEALAVPLHVAGEYAGTLWVCSNAPDHFDSGDARALSELSEFVGIALQMTRQVTGLRQSLEQQEIVASEMAHRLKNVFAVADGMVRATAKSAATPDAMVDALTGRLHALEKAHALLRQKVTRRGEQPMTTDLLTLIAAITGAHRAQTPMQPGPFHIDGPPVRCGEQAANGIALVIHELATNAFKYGALSHARGSVRINWELADDQLALLWSERGGPDVLEPQGVAGFGTTLIERTIATQFLGRLERDWDKEGLVVRMSLSLKRLAG